MKVNWYPGTTKAATEQGYETVDPAGDTHFADIQRSPENRSWRGKEQPVIYAYDGAMYEQYTPDED